MKPTATCKRCGALIAFAVTDRGKRMPLDPTPDEAGNAFVYWTESGPRVTVVSKDNPHPEGTPHMPHYATCEAQTRR